MFDIEILGRQAKDSAYHLSLLETQQKNQLLLKMADAIEENTADILAANQLDLAAADENGMKETMKDRLRLTAERISEMAHGMREIVQLPDPIGTIDEMWQTEEGLMIGRQKVPLGVIGIIYESRPNVTTDAASLCFKTGNAVILRGGRDAFHSNRTLVKILQATLVNNQQSPFAIQFVEDTSHEVATQMMHMNDYLDVLIPRGGANLIKRVKETATVPVIETGTGNNHLYIDREADLSMALDILVNAKVQRPSVCNAIETLLIHEDIAEEALPQIVQTLQEKKVALRGDAFVTERFADIPLADENDWATEYLDYILAIKTVHSTEEAIAHINHYNTKHSEAIVTNNYFTAQKFQKEVDAAAVYVNASTRFTDGFMFGFGAEIGISTQKLHARGPMGLEALTSTKYIINGTGQIRN